MRKEVLVSCGGDCCVSKQVRCVDESMVAQEEEEDSTCVMWRECCVTMDVPHIHG